MSRRARARALLVVGALFAGVSIVFLPILFGPLALLAAAGAIWSGARRTGTVLLFTSAGALALGMYLGCQVACA